MKWNTTASWNCKRGGAEQERRPRSAHRLVRFTCPRCDVGIRPTGSSPLTPTLSAPAPVQRGSPPPPPQSQHPSQRGPTSVQAGKAGTAHRLSESSAHTHQWPKLVVLQITQNLELRGKIRRVGVAVGGCCALPGRRRGTAVGPGRRHALGRPANPSHAPARLRGATAAPLGGLLCCQQGLVAPRQPCSGT